MACKPIKPFLSYEEQIQNLTERKGLIINDVPEAIKALEDISYYALIGGYKNIFYNPMTRKYNTGTTFDDILAIYYFDHALRRLFLSYICLIEEKLRSHISYHFVEAYGEEQETYLTPENYAKLAEIVLISAVLFASLVILPCKTGSMTAWYISARPTTMCLFGRLSAYSHSVSHQKCIPCCSPQ